MRAPNIPITPTTCAAMPCLCTSATLRLFIKTIAQVELPSTLLRTSPKHWQGTSIRTFSSTQAYLSTSIPFEKVPPKTGEPQANSKSWPQGWVEPGSVQASDRQAEEESSPVQSPSKVARRKKQRYGSPSAEPRVVARRTKTMNKSLTIHFSAPRAPPPEAHSAPNLDAKLKPRAFNSTKGGDDWKSPPREHWQLDKAALKEKFPEGWKPLKKLSPDALAGIRALHAQSPEQHTTEVLASNFKISPEAIRRILKSKWRPDSEEETDRQRRWLNRGKSIYTKHAELGLKPPKMWRDMGIGKGKPEWMLRNQRFREREPLPALITTRKARDVKYGSNSEEERLEDRIL